MNESPPLFAADGLDGQCAELVALLERLTAGLEGTRDTPIADLFIHRIMRPGEPRHVLQKPIFALIAQGSKRLRIGDQSYEYDPMHYLVSSVDLPVVACVSAASPAQPYLGLRLELDVQEIHAILGGDAIPPAARTEPCRGLCVNRLDAALLDAVLRLVRLLESPRDIAVLAPLFKREILYRLLISPQGALLRQAVMENGHSHRVAKAIRILRENYARPLRIEAIAHDVHMSVSSLHHHFKEVTAMSPLQYQKQLRLQEARRLMLAGDSGVASAARSVGYESASQFSREYSRLFGNAPLRDKQRSQAAPDPESPALG